MGYEYEYRYSDLPVTDDGFIELFLMIYLGVLALILLLGVACYVLRALGLYTIAKRRGLNNPWLAWIPVADYWVLGALSDQYQYLVKGQVRSRRKLLLGLNIAVVVSAIVAYVIMIVMVVRIALAGQVSDSQMASIILGPMMTMMVLSLGISVLGIVTLVFHHVCMNDVYRSCDPGNAVPFLVLGILFNFLEPIFLMVVRKKDLGMPPRKQPEPQIDVYPAVQPAPVYEQPVQEEVTEPNIEP